MAPPTEDEFPEPLDGPSFEVLRGLARDFGVTIVYGIPRRGDGDFRISQVAMGPDGEIIGFFDKIHIAQYGASIIWQPMSPKLPDPKSHQPRQ